MLAFFIRVIINTLAFYIAALILPAIHIGNAILPLLLVGLDFGILNALFKPVLNFSTRPFWVPVLGLIFSWFLNTVTLGLTAYIDSESLTIANPVWVWSIVGGFVIVLMGLLLETLARKLMGEPSPTTVKGFLTWVKF